ncbi:MAG TPA: UvrD-helicase domain-containing protein, partial [Spirochaetia bacterium]|nr:UvrD-helicase domain-containing protein [Spirochaetia bacterium]
MSDTDRDLLNDRQRQAVEATEGPLLIIAGAGSGKTRVITYRVARLLSKGVPQSQILAVTFTNKAAREMAARVKQLVPRKLARLTVSTFHAFGAQVLRERIEVLGYRPRFSIYDAQDQATLVRETASELGMKGEGFDLQGTVQTLSSIKTGRTPWSDKNRAIRPLYRQYQKNLRLYNAVDFDDLIMLPIELLSKHDAVRSEYQDRYRYLLVDEFQDTSTAQYELMRLLVGPQNNVCVVGDDDQSIYSWRGASYENLKRFERDFPGVREIKLEQNYRSTGTILRAANGLITHNSNRKPKELWTGLPEGERIEVTSHESEMEEAEHVVSRIRTLMIRESLQYQDFGVLIRANHLSRALEEVFRRENLPYVISGGMSFFERQEVRDMLAYLKLLANPDDETSLLRIVNTPKRGIGRKLIERVAERAEAERCSMFSALSWLAEQPAASAAEEKSHTALKEFLDLVGTYRGRFLEGRQMSQALKELVEEIDYWGHLLVENRDAKDKDVVKWKFGNVESLIGSLADYEEDPDNLDRGLFDYLARVSLASRDDLDSKETGGRINLMTIHSAKGLEFPVVFVAGVEQGILPHARSMEEAEENVEEERRL